MDMFLNIVGWHLKYHQGGRTRWWEWKACGFLLCGYSEKQNSMVHYRHSIFVHSTQAHKYQAATYWRVSLIFRWYQWFVSESS